MTGLCPECGRVRDLLRRGLCDACYRRWRRSGGFVPVQRAKWTDAPVEGHTPVAGGRECECGWAGPSHFGSNPVVQHRDHVRDVRDGVTA